MAAKRKPADSLRTVPRDVATHDGRAHDTGARRWRTPALVAAVAIISYVNTFSADFTLDDTGIVQRNHLIQSLANLPTFFRTHYWVTEESPDKGLYRPVTITSFALNRAISGTAPQGYHVGNVVLHTAVCLLLLAVVNLLFADSRAALLAALLFAVHPIHTEAVAGLVGRAEILALLGTLLCIYAYERARRSAEDSHRGQCAAWMAVATLGLFIAAFSKENGVVTPVLVLLGEALWPQRRWLLRGRPRALAQWGAFAATLGLYFALRATAIVPSVSHGVWRMVSSLERFATAMRVCAEYVGLLVWPARLQADYIVTDDVAIVRSPLDPGFLLSVAILIGLLSVIVIAWRRWPTVAWGLSFFLLALFPVSNLAVPIGVLKAERILYTPSAGFLVAVAAVLIWATTKVRWRIAAPAACGALVVALAVRTLARNSDWHDNMRLADITLRQTPNSIIFNNMLVLHYRELNNPAKVREHLERSLRIYQQPDGLLDLGNMDRDEGNYEAAVSNYRRCIALQPRYIAAYNNMGRVYAMMKDWPQAIAAFERVRELSPGELRAYLNLLIAYREIKDTQRGAAVADDALRRFPQSALAHFLASQIFEMAGRPADAQAARARAVALEPGVEKQAAALAPAAAPTSAPAP